MAIHIYTHTKPCPLMSGSVIRNNQKVETTQIPLAGGRITEMQYIHTTDSCLSITRNAD